MPSARPPSLALLLLALAAGPAGADARDEVMAATAKFMAARSYHVTMTLADAQNAQKMTNRIDFVAPDRYRMRMPMGTQYIIGDTMIMDLQGRTMRVPMGRGTMTQWRDPANLTKNAEKLAVTALGVEALDGKPARKYRMVNRDEPGTESVMWIGGNGYPLQIVVTGRAMGRASTTTIRYSRFNDPTIRVDPPQ